MAERERVEHLFPTAEKIDIDWENNTVRLRYQDGRDIMLSDVQVDWPALVCEMHRQGSVSRQVAKRLLRDAGMPASLLKEGK